MNVRYERSLLLEFQWRLVFGYGVFQCLPEYKEIARAEEL